ncbi:MAG: hypothetical protein IKP86_09850, partial [Anaerolineaceae bacterium]|nr:hypothetical protein [Anaerolineaceae bacterium]
MKMKKILFLLLILSIFFLLGAEYSFAQDGEKGIIDDPSVSGAAAAEWMEIDASSLSAGEPFSFTITVNSDSMLSFAGTQVRLSALICPMGMSSDECQVMNMVVDGEDNTVMNVIFEMDELPYAGDYTLAVNFEDPDAEFAAQSAYYLLKGVRESEPEAGTETPVPELTVPLTITPVRLSLSVLDEDGRPLNYGSSVFVGDPCTLRIQSDSPMNDSVTVTLALPASLRTAPLDPDCECMQYLNADGTALELPGSLWSEAGGLEFRCELGYTDQAWLPGEMIRVALEASGIYEEESFEMSPQDWNAYPMNISQHPATHQAQISDIRGNLLCSDTVSCGVLYSDEVYVLTYRFPSEWGAALPSGRSFTADVSWPAEWAASLSRSANVETASGFGSACEVGPDGITRFDLKEVSEGRYAASCVFTPGAIANAGTSSVTIHLNDNSWAVRDLNVGLSPVIIREPAISEPTEIPLPTETPVPTATAEPLLIGERPTETEVSVPTEVIPAAETATAVPPTPTSLPEYDPDLPSVTISVTLSPSMSDESGSSLIYGSTLYVGEPYYLRLASDRPMNDSVNVEIALPNSLMNAPIDPDCECWQYLNAEGTALIIPGSRWNEANGSSFRCELRYADRAWLAAEPVTFRIVPSGQYAPETFEMQPLSWNYYPVNITQYAATHQVQISDSRGNLICSDTVPCAVFNADDVYVLTYKFPADWSAPMPSGRNFTADFTWPSDWAAALQLGVDADLAAAYGTVCTADADGVTHFVLDEVSEGRYAASCTFIPSAISVPRQERAMLHLNDNSWAVSDLTIYTPVSIIKRQVSLTPSLTLQMNELTGAEEQIRSNTLSRMYRTTSDYPNTYDGSGRPALYTLRARVDGVSASRTPQYGDAVRVNWTLLDTLAAAGDLPSCLKPAGSGYQLGDLMQMEDGSWQAECSFRFPLTIPETTNGGMLQMELDSGMYNTSASVYMTGQPFVKEPVTVDLTVPVHMLLNQPTEMRADLKDPSGGISDYLRAVLIDTHAVVRGDWTYNYLTNCQGDFVLDADGKAFCSAYFNQPGDLESDMHFEMQPDVFNQLFDVTYRPSQDLHILPASEPTAELSVKLYHTGTEMDLTASDGAFVVGDDYQLQFTLKPDPEYRDVLNAVSVDGEGMVMDWWRPLVIRWPMLSQGEVSLDFYRDGDSFTARYDFSFDKGDISLEGDLNQLVMICEINGWDIRYENNSSVVRLPGRIEKKALSLSLGAFTTGPFDEVVSDLTINQEARFDVAFSGSLDLFDPTQLEVGYESNGTRTPADCIADEENGVLHCFIVPQCTDYTPDEYPSVCGTGLTLYAEYAGDAYNEPAAAEKRSFNVKRGEIRFTPVPEGSLSVLDMVDIQAATEDLMGLDHAAVTVNGWNIDTFLPREVRSSNGAEYRVYPVMFNYETTEGFEPDETLMRLDVNYQSGSAAMPVSNTISIRPRMVTDDTVYFELDFGSFEILDNGKTIREALESAVTITSLKVRYPGSALISSSSASFESEDLTFALKIATLLDFDQMNSLPGVINFNGAASVEMLTNPFTVYCSQLYQQLECSAEHSDLLTNEFGELLLPEGSDDNCWGKIQLPAG